MTLADYLEKNGLSAAAFGRAIGVSTRATMLRYVHGQRMTPPEMVEAIEQATSGDVTYYDLARVYRDHRARRGLSTDVAIAEVAQELVA